MYYTIKPPILVLATRGNSLCEKQYQRQSPSRNRDIPCQVQLTKPVCPGFVNVKYARSIHLTSHEQRPITIAMHKNLILLV